MEKNKNNTIINIILDLINPFLTMSPIKKFFKKEEIKL